MLVLSALLLQHITLHLIERVGASAAAASASAKVKV
jgi:hypothetical protein